MTVVCEGCGFAADSFKFCPECGAPVAPPLPAREQRKVVTVLFCDVTGSTPLGEQLDPEPLRALLARYFERMRGIVESHGGTVEKFIGDAVMAVFGVPVLHEDDALRACRAAVEMRDAVPELGLQGRIGLTTGEVVTGTEERLAAGDPVNVAARLQQAAAPQEVLIGEETRRLVRDAVEVEPVEPLLLKGKSAPVPAFRLLSAEGELRRADAAPMVGRETELRRLRDAFRQAAGDRSCQLFTVLGAAGVGKSRLVREFLGGLDAAVAVGRCRSYGEGTTFSPVVEVVQQLGARPVEQAAAATVASLLGESEEPASVDEIAWAVRKTLEAAAERPLVCVLDDVQWGEAALLDLVEHVADWSRDAPILLLCMARPELLERRPAWAGGKLNATTVLLEPLSEQDTERLIEALLGEAPIADRLRERIAEAAEGNPLFVEEMLALLRESGDTEVTVPPSIQALLAARLDQLDPAERAVLERAAIEGRLFHRRAVETLHPDEPQLAARLMALVRKEIVRPDKARLAGDDAFRFRHLLIRDAAYDGLPKSVRAELHERFADWLTGHADGLLDLDELVGYHLEQACRYQTELGGPVDPAIAGEARRRLTAAGRRALVQLDTRAVSLLDRAAALLAPDEADPLLEIDLLEAPLVAGRTGEARARVSAASERARAAGDGQTELYLLVLENLIAAFAESERGVERLSELVERALPAFEAAGNDLGLALCYRASAVVAQRRGQADTHVATVERALEHARRGGLTHVPLLAFPYVAASRLSGTTPVGEVLDWLGEQRDAGNRSPAVDSTKAAALAMLGRFDESRTILRDLRAELADRGLRSPLMRTNTRVAEVELLAGGPAAAVEPLEQVCAWLEQIGNRAGLASLRCRLAQAHHALGDLDRALAEAEAAFEIAPDDDAHSQMLWRQVRATVLARRYDGDEAERLAREAVAIGEQTQLLNAQADAHRDLAEVLRLAGKHGEARETLAIALDRYRRKGNLAAIRSAEAL